MTFAGFVDNMRPMNTPATTPAQRLQALTPHERDEAMRQMTELLELCAVRAALVMAWTDEVEELKWGVI